MRMLCVWPALLLGAALAADVTDEEYAQFPRLYHLDEFAGCLARSDGLYCVGSLHTTPAARPHRVYDMMQEYSSDPHHFNRTLLHRGYCVSARCPSLVERNSSLRFERCAAQWARKRNLRVALTKLSYCRSHAQELSRARGPASPDTPHRLFLWAVGLLLLGNLVGTTYDVLSGDDARKLPKLVSWSVRSNWRRLTATYEDGDPRLAALTPVQGLRVLLMGLIMSAHAACVQVMLYLQNPRWVEQVSRHPALMLFLNSTPGVQLFVMMAHFLLAYNLLLASKKYNISFKMLPYMLAKRVARTWPLHMLAVGFAATWWPRTGSGPMWPLVVGAESEVCRNKFWSHALFIHNLVSPDDKCLVQTWFIAVDFQLHVLATALSLYLVPRRRRALPVLGALVLASCALTGLLAYVFEWQPLVHYVYPSTLQNMHKGNSSFSRLYMAPWGSLTACFIGLFLAHLHFELQEAGVDVSSPRLLELAHSTPVVLIISWALAGNWLQQYRQRWFTAVYVALERLVFGVLVAIQFLGMINGLNSFLKRFFAWRGWHAMGRMSLAVMMVHWCLNMTIAASRPYPIYSSLLSVIVDFLATGTLSYVLAVPLTVMVEMPVQRFVCAFII